MAFPFKYEKNVAFFHVKTWKSSKSWMLASTSVFDNYTFFFQIGQKKIGKSRIPEGIWSLETIRHIRG